MNTYRVGCQLLFGALATAGIVIAGCSSNDPAAAGEADGVLGNAQEATTVEFTVNPDFSGNSVKIHGKRHGKPDGKYPCKDEFDVCRDFDTKGYASAVDNLCPTADLGAAGATGDGKWDFTYVVYNGKCGDTSAQPITDGIDGGNDHNFICYDKQTPFKNPNQSKDEVLKPGKNRNDILCVTKNASKDWEFDVCVDVTPAPDGGTCPKELDCGCKPIPNHALDCPPELACDCGENAKPPPAGFHLDLTSCHYVQDPI